jgi:hypothetical protein
MLFDIPKKHPDQNTVKLRDRRHDSPIASNLCAAVDDARVEGFLD